MGYDMYLVESAQDEAAYEAAQAEFNQAVKVRDAFPRGSAEAEQAQVRVSAAYDAMQAANTDYFRLNMWGMRLARDLMERCEMFAPEVLYSWPEKPETTVDAWDIEYALDGEGDLPAGVTPDDVEKVRQWRAQTEEILAAYNRDAPGVQAHKFSSNDGWRVTPAECRSVVFRWRTVQRDDPALASAVSSEAEWWQEWMDWFAHAAEHGGFRVH